VSHIYSTKVHKLKNLIILPQNILRHYVEHLLLLLILCNIFFQKCSFFRRQEAGGRRQEAGGRRQEAGGRRQEAGGKS
jgi:hypothetical protein